LATNVAAQFRPIDRWIEAGNRASGFDRRFLCG